MPTELKFKGVLLEYKEGEYQGSAYTSIKVRSNDIADATILKYKVDPKKTGQFKEMIDKE